MDEEYIRTEDILEEDTVNDDQGEPMDDDESDDDDMGNIPLPTLISLYSL